jgi:hypothetical protein
MVGTQTRPLNIRSVARLLARPLVSRPLATLGILVMTLGLYVPVAGREFSFVPLTSGDAVVNGGSVLHTAETWTISKTLPSVPWALFHPGHVPVGVQLGFTAVQSLITFGGLGLIPLLWRPLSASESVPLRWVYAAWIALLSILAFFGAASWWQSTSNLPWVLGYHRIGVRQSFVPGAAVFPLGVLIGCVALVLMWSEPPATISAPARRTGWQWAAALILTLGALVWGVGFYLMPEVVTQGCPPITFAVTHFAHGACGGRDSSEVLKAAYYAGLGRIDHWLFRAGQHFELLVALAGITTLGGWTRRYTVSTLAWLSVWPVLALGVALVAMRGVGLVARQAIWQMEYIGDGWHVAPGMVVTFGGIGLVVLGQLGLWREWWRRKQGKSAG